MKNDERSVRDLVQRNLTPVIPNTLDFSDRQRLENAAADERRRVEEKKKSW
ncbi:MAG: hypothetical protein JNL81_15405 [Hyphomonadaceae bacterium]|nr:hypothetical protein [Hyphomonadaceae bacterium]